MKKRLFALVAVSLIIVSPALALASDSSGSAAREQLKTKVAELKTARQNDKEEIRAQVLSNATKLSTNSIDRVVARYLKLISIVNKLPNLTADQKSSFQAQVQSQIAILNAKRNEIASSDTLTSAKAVIETAKAQVKASNKVVEQAMSNLRNVHLNNIVTRLNAAISKIDAKIADAKAAGEDTSVIDSMFVSAKADVASAVASISADNYSVARASIVSAKTKLIEILHSIDALNGSVNPTEEN